MNINKRILSFVLGLNIAFFAVPSLAFAGWPEDSVTVESKEAIPPHSGEVYSMVSGDMTYKIEFQSQIKQVKLKDPSSPTGAADWWESTAILKGYYYSSKGAPVITHSMKCSFLSNGHIVKLNPMCKTEHEEHSHDPSKWKVTGWHEVHSSETQKVVTLQLNAWHASHGVFSTTFKDMDNSHVNVECTPDGEIKFYILPGKFFKE